MLAQAQKGDVNAAGALEKASTGAATPQGRALAEQELSQLSPQELASAKGLAADPNFSYEAPGNQAYSTGGPLSGITDFLDKIPIIGKGLATPFNLINTIGDVVSGNSANKDLGNFGIGAAEDALAAAGLGAFGGGAGGGAGAIDPTGFSAPLGSVFGGGAGAGGPVFGEDMLGGGGGLSALAGGGSSGGGLLGSLHDLLNNPKTGNVDLSKILNIGAAGAGLAGQIAQRKAAEAAANQVSQMATQSFNMAGENQANKMNSFGNQSYMNLGNSLARGANGPTDIFNQSIAKQPGGNPNITPGGVAPGTGTATSLGFSPQGGGTPPAPLPPSAAAPPPALTPGLNTMLGNMAGQFKPPAPQSTPGAMA